jgi:hypothetical protein
LFLPEHPNTIYHIVKSNFSFIQIRNGGEDPIRISKRRLKLIKEFIKIEYYYIDPESHNFAISRSSNSKPYPHLLTAKEHNILITHDIDIYQDTRPQNLDRIVAKYPNL